MLGLLWLLPTAPLAGFLTLTLAGRRLSRAAAALIGVGAVALATIVAMLIAVSFIGFPPAERAYAQTLWTWMRVGDFTPGITFYLDALSLVMALVITFVGFLIHLYSVEFMIDEDGYSRFFAYMNLFVASMLVLVLADNLLLLYLGWEGVGVCSYLLIGFWYKDPVNGAAARKAFIVTRIGDTAMAIGLFLFLANLGTLQIQELMGRAASEWHVGSALPVTAAALLLGGAVGKSAQVPLQTWLPDAMAGPTPVSALIHAATMVTAGVYLIARVHVIFELAPAIQSLVAVIGAVTLLIAGFSALTQWNIKRVLAYSTISQIGYMFLALGVGAWPAAIFHFMTHAFFKALLFLGAGAVILSLHHEHDMFKMGGLRAQLPLVFWTFLIGSASLAALPLVTAGFYSKDLILWHAWSSSTGGPWLWAAGLAGALLTSLYTFRMVIVSFFGEARIQARGGPGICMKAPLVVLAVLSIIGGFLELPDTLAHYPVFSDFMSTALPAATKARGDLNAELTLQIIAGMVSLIGIYLAYLFYARIPLYGDAIARTGLGAVLHRLWFTGWGFDWLYDKFIVQPYLWTARANKNDCIDLIYDGVAALNRGLYRMASRTQTGQLRWYATGVVLGAVVTLAIAVFL